MKCLLASKERGIYYLTVHRPASTVQLARNYHTRLLAPQDFKPQALLS